MSELNIQRLPPTGMTIVCPNCETEQMGPHLPSDLQPYTCHECKAPISVSGGFVRTMTIYEYLFNIGIWNNLLKLVKESYKRQGRGIIILDARTWPTGIKTYYLPETVVAQNIGWPEEKIGRDVETYTPDHEAIVHIMGNADNPGGWQRIWTWQGYES